MPAGWTIRQITHCSVGLANSDSLANNSTASALGEADLTTTATISKRAGKAVRATTVTTAATLATIKAKTSTLTATAVTTSASIGTVKVLAPTVSVGDQGIAQLVAAVGGGVGV